MEREYIERNAVLEEALSDKAVRGGLADETDIKRIIADVISADVVSVREYQELADENRELKRLLKLAIADFECVTKMCDETQCENCPHNYMRNYPCDCWEWQYKDEAENLLKSETLAEFQPVVHANWTVLKKRKAIFLDNANEQYKALGFPHRNILQMRCSNCGVFTQVDDSIAYEYCPHCGAKMDGD